MADDIYLEILKMKAGKPPKVHKDYVKTGPVLMKKYAEKYIKKAKGYTPKKVGKPAQHFIFDATMTILTIDEGKKKTECKIVAMTGPVSMKNLARITGGATVPDTSKGSAEACMDAVMAALVKDTVKTLKKFK